MPKTRFAGEKEGWPLKRSFVSKVLPVLIALHATASLAPAAQRIVNVCGQDNAPGGLNLIAAAASGEDILIECPAGQQTITITNTLNLPASVRLDGSGKVSLQGALSGPLFNAPLGLRLGHIIVENKLGPILAAPRATVELDDVTTQNSPGAYTALTFIARNSRFRQNGNPSQAAPGAIINAETTQLTQTTFSGNFDHPIVTGLTPQPGQSVSTHRASIDDSTFSGNKATLLLTDANVSINRTRFESNGVPPAQWGQSWGCCGGAITLVRSLASIGSSQFRSNVSSGFGGAIYALASRVLITDSLFEANSARAAGAVMFWGRLPNASAPPILPNTFPPPQLDLRRTQFHNNYSSSVGGALLFAGAVTANTVLFRANQSASAGGAIADWNAASLADPYRSVVPALVSISDSSPRDTLALARPILVDNVTGVRGAAVAASAASVAIGNGLIARNNVKTWGGGSLNTAKLIALVNTTVADNPAGGLTLAPGGSAELGNAIFLRNSNFNCLSSSGTAKITDRGGNLQYPSSDCSASIAVRDAGLDDQYTPSLTSAARVAASPSMCASDPEVLGVDLLGRTRLIRGRCDSGAMELPLPDTVAASLGLGAGVLAVRKLFWLLLLISLLLFLLGFFWKFRRRHRAA